METSCLPNRIQMTANAAETLVSQGEHWETLLDFRGSLNIKGKGLMNTFFLRLDELDSVVLDVGAEVDHNQSSRFGPEGRREGRRRSSIRRSLELPPLPSRSRKSTERDLRPVTTERAEESNRGSIRKKGAFFETSQ